MKYSTNDLTQDCLQSIKQHLHSVGIDGKLVNCVTAPYHTKEQLGDRIDIVEIEYVVASYDFGVVFLDMCCKCSQHFEFVRE